MNIDTLENCINTIGYSSGIILTIEEICMLQASLIILQRDNHFQKVYFWGKILAYDYDYYIAFGYHKDILNCKTFFYSLDAKTWNLAPKPNPKSNALTPLCATRFQGKPALVATIDEQSLKEEDRLASTIAAISYDALITPRGALIKQADGKVYENHSYEGLSLTDAKQLSSFMHFRTPKHRWNTNLLTRSDYNYSLDFLDTIDKDIPGTSWSLQLKDKVVVLRSLHWPGASFYQHVGKPEHGWLYIGYGKHNLDIPHMLHKWD